MSQQRERLGSRLGFILLSAGCAIGCGNVWKFPWLCGQNGGGAFLLVYFLFLILLGLPVMTAELAIGRASQRSPVRMYYALEPAGTKWHAHGYVALAANVLLMMFYTSVAGWILYYFCRFISGSMTGLSTEEVSGVFTGMLANPKIMCGFMAAIVIAGYGIISFGLQKGLERVTKYMMCALLVLMVILAVYNFTLDGAAAGLKFYLLPDFRKINGQLIVAAMNQAFFTLSLGIGAMAIFGSYIGKDRSLFGESARIVLLDTFVAVVAGLIIFPSCFTYGIEPGQGPSLLFIAMTKAFSEMPNGTLWGSLFFLFMFFAAMTTILAVFENILACVCELSGWSRKKGSLICGIGVLLLSVPCALGYNVLSGVTPFGDGSTILDLEDFLVSNLMLPIGSVIMILFCTLKNGMGWKRFTDEANSGAGLKVKNWMRPYMTFILPLIITAVLVIGLVEFF